MPRCRAAWGDLRGRARPRASPWTPRPGSSTASSRPIASDTWGLEVLPNETPDVFQPLHIILIVHMGLLVGEIFDLEALADDCASDGTYEFLFTAPPLPITGGVGSPVNPLAIR